MARSSDSWMWLAAVGGLAYLAYQKVQSGAGANMPGIPFYSTTPTPYSVYPEWGYTAQTSMAATPAQKAPAAVTPTPYYQSVQSQEQAALLTQCIGSFPSCTPMLGDTQLGF